MPEDNSNFSSEPFGSINQYYDLLYADKDYQAETRYIISLIKKYSPAAEELLELGFGTANYSKHFSEAGYHITGIEKSERMVEVATTKQIRGFVPVIGDITAFELNKKFDAAVSLFHVTSYLTENTSVVSCFKRVSEHLNKNSLFIFDVWYTPAVYLQQPETRIKRLNTDNYEIFRLAEPEVFFEQNLVQVNYTLLVKNKASLQCDVLKESHLLRHFSTPELTLMAEICGLKLLGCEEFLTGNKPSEKSWGVCYILKKQ